MKRFLLKFFIWSTTFLLHAHMAYATDRLVETPDSYQRIAGIYQQINKNWQYPLHAKTPVEATSSWKVINVQTNVGFTSAVAWNYEKQPKFSVALEELISTKLVMDCSNAARIARLALINCEVGDEGMLKLCSLIKIKNSEITDFNLINQMSWSYFKKTDSLQDGHFYAFPCVNLPDYPQYKDGFDAIHNIIRLPNRMYWGFDPAYFVKPQSHDALVQFLFEKITEPKNIKPGKEKAHSEFCEKLSFEEFVKCRQVYQLQVGHFVFDLKQAKADLEANKN
jgi:hypothetical protein